LLFFNVLIFADLHVEKMLHFHSPPQTPQSESPAMLQKLLHQRFCLHALLLVASWSSVSYTASATDATNSPSCCVTLPRPCNSIWLVSTRAFPCGDPRLHVNELSYHVLDENNEWQPSSLAAFLATDDPAITTIFWAHGNRSTRQQAVSEGMGTYRRIARCSTCDTPMRFVIFSWPADRTGSQLEDIRIKAQRTDPNGYYLAWLVDQVSSDVPVSLIGYSYGARIAAAALHLLGGGTINCWALTDRVHPNRPPLHVVLVAAAFDNHWLIPGHHYGNALSQVAHMTIIYNPCDRVLKRYRFVYCRRSKAQALGYTGFAGLGCLSPIDRAKICQINSSPYMGKSHDVNVSISVGPLNAALRNECLPRNSAGLALKKTQKAA
jgi:hypothetical protein